MTERVRPASPIPVSVYDPTGLAPAGCDHGLPVHPVTGAVPRLGKSWVRSRYLTADGRCPVCRGGTVPADLTTPRE